MPDMLLLISAKYGRTGNSKSWPGMFHQSTMNIGELLGEAKFMPAFLLYFMKIVIFVSC